MITVLLLGPKDDVSVRRIHTVLQNTYYAQTCIWDTSKLSSQNPATFSLSEDEIVFPCATGSLRWSEIDVGFWRSIAPSPPPESCSHHDTPDVWINNHTNFLLTLLRTEHFPWVNAFNAYTSHRCKPLQLQKVQELGIRVPKTIITNDFQEAQSFLAAHREIVIKPVWSGDHAQVLSCTPDDLAVLEYALSCSPHTLQECVRGTNIRTYVIGKQTFSVRIEAKTTDFRLDPEHDICVWDLPFEQKRQALQLTRALQMDWTAIDWRLDQEHNVYFLEANFSPMFVGVEAQTGLPLTHALCRLLLSKAEQRPPV